jgi:hypothetical protein
MREGPERAVGAGPVDGAVRGHVERAERDVGEPGGEHADVVDRALAVEQHGRRAEVGAPDADQRGTEPVVHAGGRAGGQRDPRARRVAGTSREGAEHHQTARARQHRSPGRDGSHPSDRGRSSAYSVR